MAKLYTSTAKYYELAIRKFLPLLEKLKQENVNNVEIEEELIALIEAYSDISSKIRKNRLNFDDPNKLYPGEPHDIELDLNEKVIEDLSRLVLRLLLVWRARKEKLEARNYLSSENQKELWKLEELIWPLEAQFEKGSGILSKSKDKVPIEFPGENKIFPEQEGLEPEITGFIFPLAMVNSLPGELQVLCQEFNFNFKNKKPNACILLLRRILPLSIVRKFQKMTREPEIMASGEYLDTKGLMGKVESVLKTKRLHREIVGYKLLLDSSQHSFTTKFEMIDAEGAGVKIRLFLQDLFE